jgi:hypothetical protein
MANIKISDLTSAASVSGTQQFEVNESGTSKKVTGAQIAAYVEGEVSSSPTFTGQVSNAAGSAAAPSISVTGDTNTGIYFPAADTIAISTGGTLRVSVNSSGSLVTVGDIELGNVSDTTLSRSSAGVIAVEGVTVPLNSVTNTHTAQQIELGHASDTTISRVSAGVIAVEGQTLATLSSPAFTNTPTAPTAVADTNTTQLATTAYVVGQGYLKSSTASTTYQTALGFTPVQQGGGTSQLSNKLYIGWSSGSQLRLQIDTTDFGATWPINISGSAAAPSTAAVLGATAAAAVGEVGTYAFLRSIASTAYNPGATVAGSLLSYTNANGGGGNPSPAGSWRLMGSTGTQTNSALASLWLRIS